MKPVMKDELDKMAAHGCAVPGCNHADHDGTIFLHGRCHIKGRLEVSYTIRSGVLKVACRECGWVVANVAVQGAVGAMGEAPTSNDPTDQGSMRAMLSLDDGRVRVDFGKMLSWVSMTKEQAEGFANEFLWLVDQLPKEG